MLKLTAYDEPIESARAIRGGHGAAFVVRCGQFLTVTDVEGQQVADFFAWRLHDRTEFMSPHNTRLLAGALVPGVGSRFVSNRRRPMLVLVHDTVGVHDLLMASCDPARYASFGVADHRSCVGNAEEALRECGMTVPRLYDPVNLFMNVPVDAEGRLSIQAPVSKAGDRVTFRATTDVLAVISACPMDLNLCNGGRVTDLHVRVHNEFV